MDEANQALNPESSGKKKKSYQTTVTYVNRMKVILLLMILYSIYETAILIVMVPDEFRQLSSWYMRRSRLIRLQNEELWFEPIIVIALILQTIEFISVLFEFTSLATLFCFAEFFVTAYRFERAIYEWQFILASFWILICLTFLFYLALLFKLYRHAKLDKYAYRIPTPEISAYNILGQEKIGVYAKSY